MPREIKNPFPDLPGYRCFGCDPENNLGLRMKFYADDEKGEVFTTIKPEYHFSGFPASFTAGFRPP